MLAPLLLLAAGAFAAPPPTPSFTPDPAALALQDAFRKIAASVKPAVVSIDTVFTRTEEEPQFFFGDPDQLFHNFFGEGEEEAPRRRPRRRMRVEGVGSGVVTDSRGYVLTNEHVVGGADEIKVIVKDPEEKVYKGKVVGTDPTSDLAVVKIDAGRPLNAAPLGDSSKVRVGDWAIAIGSPFGLEQTVTVGVISAVRQSLVVEGRNYADFLQTDASINQGNSGGPLVDARGEVIGINTAIYSPMGVSAGIGFAIPSNQAARIMTELIEKGRVIRGWVGIEIAPLDEVLARQFKVPNAEGVLVNAVLDKSPAAKAGLERGDAIVEFDGRKTPSAEAFTKMVADTPPKKKVALKIVRGGKTQDLTLVTGERPAKVMRAKQSAPQAPSEESASADWEGARLRAPADVLRRRYGLPDEALGAVVVAVDPDSRAEAMGLQPGDLIAGIDGQTVESPEDFLKAAKRASLAKGVVLDVGRRGRSLYLTYREGR